MMIGGTTRAAVSPAATPSLARAIRQRGDRLGQQVDRGPVLDLGAEGRGAEDERDEREDGADHERIEDLGGVVPSAAEADEQPDQDRQAASRTMSRVRRRPSRPRSVTATSAPNAVIGGPGSRTRSRGSRRSA